MPITALPSPYGVGTMGKEARKFIDWLEKAGQSYWQILPIGPTGYGDSPYQSFSSFAGSPYLIDLDDLKKEGLLKKGEYENVFWGDDPNKVDYGVLYNERFKVLRKASDRILKKKPEDYDAFMAENDFWLEEYALFMSVKSKYEGVNWLKWPEDIRHHEAQAVQAHREELIDDVIFWKNIQYMFFHQYHAMKAYAGDHHVGIIGDLPIYVSPDSSDIWANQEQFQLDEDGKCTRVAGCPPDGFSADGQLWGNPLYRWDYMKERGYDWWEKRIGYQLKLFDILRIDHFRGFAGYYSIPAEDTTAINGMWVEGPGIDFFRTMEQKLGNMNIIAEDLGYLTDDVLEMVKETGYPGMKVLEFAFDPGHPENQYLPHNYGHNCVVYAGTHDNETIEGWLSGADKKVVKLVKEYLNLDKEEGYHWGVMQAAYVSVADLAVMQLQDILGLGNEARINTPSTTGNNWVWRMTSGSLTTALARKLRSWMEIYGRIGH